MNGGKVENNAAGTNGTVPAIEGGANTSKIIVTGGTINSKGTGIKSANTPVEITGGIIDSDWFALETRYAIVNPTEGKTVNMNAGKAILNPYSAPTSGEGNQIIGGKFDAPALTSSFGDGTNVKLYGGTYTNNNVVMDVTSYLSGATVDANGTVTCNHTETYEEGAVDATCTTEGRTADVICSNCKKTVTQGSKIEKQEHTYGEWVIDKEATCTEKGSKYQECACGEKKTEEILVIAHNYENGECTVCGDIEKLPEPETKPEPEPEPEIGDVDFIIPEDNVEGNNTSIGVVESETVKETLDTSLKADTELNKTVEEERQKGNQVTVEITMEELDNNDVNEEEKQKILETVEENQTVHQYFDISVLVKTNEKELGKLTQLTEKMKFSMEISKDLIKEGRKFFIIKSHGDEVKIIEATLNGIKLEFETDQFSTFALAYEDAKAIEDGEEDNSGDVPGESIEQPKDETEEPKEEAKEDVNVPNTGDNIVLYIVLVLIAVAGIIVSKKLNTTKSNH